jgi:hypothetical protein
MEQIFQTLPFKTERRIYEYLYIPSDRGCGKQVHQKFNLARGGDKKIVKNTSLYYFLIFCT